MKQIGGYWYVRVRVHPRCGSYGYVAEHVLVAEKALGHYLDLKHPVHHIDGNSLNNDPSNLVVCEDVAYHQLLHMRQRALDACGNAAWRPCAYCKCYDAPEQMRVHSKQKSSRFYHPSCSQPKRKGPPRTKESRTECKRGHPLFGDNVRFYRGKAVCRKCNCLSKYGYRDRARRSYEATT